MKRLLIVVVSSLAIFLPSIVSAQTPQGDSKKVTMNVSDTFVVGNTTVKPGEYKFQCRLINGQDYLVVTAADGKEIARVPCTPEMLKAPADSNQILSRKGDGVIVVTAVRFKGEAMGHRLVLTEG